MAWWRWRGVFAIGLASGAVAVACGGKSGRDDRPSHPAAGDAGGESADTTSSGGHGGAAPNAGGFGAALHTAGEGGVAGLAGEGGALVIGGADGGAGAGGEGGWGGAGGSGGELSIGPGDINADGCVDLEDWVILARDYGCSLQTCGDPRADLQPDGWLDEFDLLILREHWWQGERCGPSCEPVDDDGAGGGSGGQAGAGSQPAIDLDGDGCVSWDDVAVLAPSYGCDLTCAAPGTDVVPDGCVTDVDVAAILAAKDTAAWCAP